MFLPSQERGSTVGARMRLRMAIQTYPRTKKDVEEAPHHEDNIHKTGRPGNRASQITPIVL